MEKVFSKHERATLFYSGGKDSLCCLLLAKPWWDRLDVVWVDTGNQFPEVREHMDLVKAAVPNFSVIHGNTPEYFKEHGFPVDVVPTRHTKLGQELFGMTELRFCSRFDCCAKNIWAPAADYMRLHRPTCVIRGDRGTERLKGVLNADGVEFAYPIFDWTDEQVLAVVRTAPGGLYQPRHELRHGSSLDCITCTAYQDEHEERMAYLKQWHPRLWEMQVEFFRRYKAVVLEEINEIKE